MAALFLKQVSAEAAAGEERMAMDSLRNREKIAAQVQTIFKIADTSGDGKVTSTDNAQASLCPLCTDLGAQRRACAEIGMPVREDCFLIGQGFVLAVPAITGVADSFTFPSICFKSGEARTNPKQHMQKRATPCPQPLWKHRLYHL